jgi:hypothetical protein
MYLYLDVVVLLLLARIDVVVFALFNDVLGLLAGEQQVHDHAEGPAQKVAIVAILPSPGRIPALRMRNIMYCIYCIKKSAACKSALRTAAKILFWMARII